MRKSMNKIAIAFGAAALVASTVLANDAQSGIEDKIQREVAGRYRAITATANARDDAWMARHATKAAAAANSAIAKDVVFLGDDAMAGWETVGAGAMSAFGSANIFNLGYAGDCTENVLWRVTDGGELSGYTAKAVVVMVGGNNSATYTKSEEGPIRTLFAIFHTLAKIRAAQPNAKIIVNSILPRGTDGTDAVRCINGVVNEDLRKWVETKGEGYVWCDLTDLFVDKAGNDALKTQYFESDKVTLNASGYAVWANAIKNHVSAAVNGTTLPANLVCERRPLQGSATDSTYGTSRDYPGLGYWDKLANFLYGNGVQREADVVLLGDSITEKWAGPEMSSSMYSLGTKVMNLGNSGDMTENLLWRLENGELDGYTSKIFNILIGTNNTQEKNPLDTPEAIAAGVRKVIDLVLEKHPESKITLVPILPFGHVSRPDWGRMLNETNQAANVIIRTFADNQRVFLADVDNSLFYNADGTFNAEMYVADERNLHYLHLSAKGYSDIVAPAIRSAIAAAGTSGVVLPSVGSVSPAVSGTKATLSVADVVKGTDSNGSAAGSYTIFYKVDGAAEKSVAGSQTGVTASFETEALADGPHTCAVWIKNSAGLVSSPKRVTFNTDSKENEVGWSLSPMDESGTGFRSSGTTVFANGYGYSPVTANGVDFSCSQYLPSADKVSFSPADSGRDGWGANNPLFPGGWYWNKSAGASMDLTATFKGLTSGTKYVAQLLVGYCRLDSTRVTSVTAGGLAPVTASEGSDFKYGVIVTRVFVASGATEDVKVTFAGDNTMCFVKAVQLRDLGAGEEGGEEGEGNEGGEGPGQESDPPAVTPAGSNYLSTPVPGSDSASAPCTAKERTDDYHKNHFAEDLSVVEKSHKNFDVVLFGDSITDFWVNPNLSLDGGLTNTVNMGIGSDRTQNLLWRVRNGALDGYTTKFLTLLIGVNNSHQKRIDENIPCDRPEDIADSIRLILNEMVAKHPESKILLMPIIPYCYDSRYYDGLEVRNTNEDVNDYIIKFVDNKRIFWVDFRRQFLNSDATCNHSWYRDGGNPGGGYDAVGTCLHPAIASYSEIFKPALTSAMQRYLALPAGAAQVAEPSLGYASAEPDGVANSATITVRGIFLGTDSSANPVTSYTLAYDLDNGAKTGVLTNQTLTRNSFTIPEVGSGDHTCTVTITTASGKVLTTSVDFAMTEGWAGAPLPADSSAVRTDGTLAYAYAIGNYTVNGVPFVRAYGAIASDIEWPYASDSGSSAPAGVEAGGYSDLLTHCWWANQGEKTVTLKNLTAGKKYLVQMFGYRNYSGFEKTHVWIKESFRDVNYIKILGEGWTYGGTLTGYFTASSSTKSFTIAADSNYAVNGIQVRMLGEGEIDPGPVNPPAPTIYNLTVPAKTGLTLQSVTTNGIAVAAVGGVYPIVKGTAVKVTFSAAEGYEIVGNDYVTLTMNGTTTLTSYPTVNQKGGSGGGEGGGEEGGEETPPAPVAAGWTVTVPTSTEGLLCTTGTLVYAYAPKALTVGGISFTGDETLSNTDFTVAQTNSGYDGNIGSGGQTGEWAKLMGQTWRWSNTLGAVDVTLNGLEAGNDYLVQFISHNGWSEVTVGGGDAQKQPNSGNLGASVVGVFTATASSQTVTVTFGGSAGWRTINAVQVRRLGAASDDPGPVNPPAPTVYNLTVPAKTGLALQSVTTNGVSVAAVGGVYPITENTSVTVTFAAAEGYEIVSGNPVVFTVTADKTLADAEYPVVQETTSGGGDEPGPQPPADITLGWTAAALTADASSVRTDGTLVYAYARTACTANGVAFEGSSRSAISNRNVEWSGFTMDVVGPDYAGVTDDGYHTLLKYTWSCMHTYTHPVTLKNLTKGRYYLVQFFGARNNASNDAEIWVEESGDSSIKMRAGGSAWPYGGTLVGIFQAEGTEQTFNLKFVKSSQDWTSWNGLQVRELSEVGPTPADAPVIGGEGVDVPMAVSADKVAITISNAAVGHTYGYKKSVTLEGLATADVISFESPAVADGVLTLEIPKDPAEPSCFYQIVVE